MNLIKKAVIAAAAGLITTLLSFFSGFEAVSASALVFGAVVFVASLAILNLDTVFPKLDGEFLGLVSAGVFIGLLTGAILSSALSAAGIAGNGFELIIYAVSAVFFGYTGYMFARYPGLKIFGGGHGASAAGISGQFSPSSEAGPGREKILDTSVIIDGRILDIAETRFLEGPFIIPNFVLREIQLISDSPDPVKRNRGRRGLDMLNKLQQNDKIPVKISYADYAETREVDAKLVKLARETGAHLITNDFNLNKVAELQGVSVLNLNSLTNALKPVVLPGEEILIDVIKEGKDENQGIGYLEDGTMVVVENGRSLLNKTVRVNVTSIIQTAAGKMIFTRAAGAVEEIPDAQQPREDYNKGGRRDNRRPQGGNRGNRNTNPRDMQSSYEDMMKNDRR